MRAVLAAAGLALGACVPAAQVPAGAADTPYDTLTGTVAIVGSDPGTFLSLRPAGGGTAIVLTGEAAAPLRSVSGADVLVAGTRADTGFVVRRFIVRRVNGQDVHDGVITSTANGLALTTDEVVIPIPDTDPQLRRLVGARVWLTSPVAGRVPSYGEIRAPD